MKPNISSAAQIKVLRSPVRQEIFDTIRSNQHCSVKELAEQMSMPADGLYYHIKLLLKQKLIIEKESRRTKNRDEKIYTIPPGSMMVKYDLKNARNKKLVKSAVDSMIKMVSRDFVKAMELTDAAVEGKTRELWAARYKGWLTKSELIEVNSILQKLSDKFKGTGKAVNKKLYSLSFVISPLNEKPIRRTNK